MGSKSQFAEEADDDVDVIWQGLDGRSRLWLSLNPSESATRTCR